MNKDLSGKWDVGCGNGDGTFTVAADGSFTVKSAGASKGCWASASGKITGHTITIAFSNGVKDHGVITADNAYIKWASKGGGTWTRDGAATQLKLGDGKEVVLKFVSC